MVKKEEHGFALMMVLVVSALLLSLASGLTMLVISEVTVVGRQPSGMRAGYVAEAALERGIREVSGLPDWSSALNGSARSSWYAEGEPVLRVAMTRVSLAELPAGMAPQTTGCEGEEPVWRLFGFGPVSALAGSAGSEAAAVWVADDCGEEDDDPRTDGNGVVMMRAMAAGSWSLRKWVQATIARTDTGTRTLAWREIRDE